MDGFERPVYVTHAGDGSGRLFVLEKRGRIRVVAAGQVRDEPFLDIVDLVGSAANEQGLLGLAFHPDYRANGRFFVNYIDRRSDTVIAAYRVSSDDPNRADPASAGLILTFDQPFGNHNGGMLAFGPDGYLYIGTGDGGSAGDPFGNAQNPDRLLGKMLRIDVDGDSPYAVPPDNPFVDDPEYRPEIWALGLRNPWRYSFDRATGDLFIADVGQNRIEEIHFQPAGGSGGENYGWNVLEGTRCFQPRSGCIDSGLELPVAEYDHGQGCSVTGGHVYRGTAYPALVGKYVFADYCSGRIWTLERAAAGQWQMTERLRSDAAISSFGEDEGGELYLTDDRGGRLFRVQSGEG